MEYPTQYSSFKCAVCKIINDIDAANENESPGKQVFDIHQFKATFDEFMQSKDENLLNKLKKEINETFSSIPNVVATLLPKESIHLDRSNASSSSTNSVSSQAERRDKSTEQISSESSLQNTQSFLLINTETLDKFYALMAGKSQTLTNTLMFALDSLLERPRFQICGVIGLKFTIIALLNPLFLHSAMKEEIFFHQRLMQRLFGFIVNQSFSFDMIQFLYKNVPRHVFRKLVEITNFFVTQRVLVPEIGITNLNIYSDWAVEAALLFERNLVQVNEIEFMVSESEFYNSGLDAINMIYDFESWRNSIEFARKEHFYFCEFPFALSLACKMKIFNYESGKEQGILAEQAIIESLIFFEPINPFCVLRISRDRIIHDSLTQISEQKHQLKKKLKVEFTDESGLDAGGLAKEWLLLLVRDLFNPIQGLFCSEEDGRFLWFCPTRDYPNKLEVYQLCGIIIGLAMYNGILLDLPLPLVCYKKLLGEEGKLEDLREFKPEIYRNLKFILNYKNEQDFESVFSLNFIYYDSDMEKKVNLFPTKQDTSTTDNEDISVTFSNRELYVSQYVDYLLNKRIEPIFKEFRTGFLLVCNGLSLSLFKPYEIEALVNGSKEAFVNVALIKENSVYSSGFHSTDPIVKQFWEIFDEYDDQHKRKLLRFVTGSDRLPCVGSPADFGIHVSCLGSEDSDRYPIAHTCFNQLCLYRYSSKEKLKTKLTTAIDECTGFDLK